MSTTTAIANAREKAEAAGKNEQVTRMRVSMLEDAFGSMAKITAQHMDFMEMGLLDRLRWLLFGTLPSRTSHSEPKSEDA